MSNGRQGQRKSLEGWTRASGRLAIQVALSLCLMLCGVARPAWATGVPGSYAIVFDAAGEPIAGTYWIAPDVRVVMRGHTREGTGRPTLPTLTPILMDREFLTTRLSAPVWLRISRFDQSPTPTIEALKLGSPVTIVRQEFSPVWTSVSAMAARPEPTAVPETRDGSTTFTLTLLASQVLKLGDAALTAHTLETRGGNLADQDAWIPPARALLLAETGMLIDQDRHEPPTRIERGALTSSADFISYFEMLAYRAKLPATAACLEGKRTTETFRRASAAYREVVDTYSAKSFPLSSLSYETVNNPKEIEARFKDAVPYLLCPP